jgi:SNF2 family DNA or RNA helicase
MRKKFAAREYQTLIVEHVLRNKRCNVFAGMGMGKTVSTLTAIDAINVLEGTTPALILAPKRVAHHVWPEEAEKWSHLHDIRVMPIAGTARQRVLALREDANVFTTNYEQIPWLVEHYADAGRWPFKLVVADESTRLKSFRLRQGGARAASLARVAHSQTERWVNLTGTPAPNGMADMWGQNWFVDRGERLGKSYSAFSKRWFARSWDGYGIAPQANAQAQITEAMRDVTLVLNSKDWFDLKDPIVTNIYVDLPEQARRVYTEMEKRMYVELQHDQKEYGVEAFNAAARTMKCLQIANGAAYVERGDSERWADLHDAKLEALESIVEEANGMPVLVAYQWKSDRARIMKVFPKARCISEGGDILQAWNRGEVPILLAHPKSAGHGLNLQEGGNIIAFFGLWWDLEQHQQIIERIGPTRQAQAGLERNVWVYRIVAKNTVDEDVLTRLETKREVQDILMDSQRRSRHGQ